jgi:hypothetical protein
VKTKPEVKKNLAALYLYGGKKYPPLFRIWVEPSQWCIQNPFCDLVDLHILPHSCLHSSAYSCSHQGYQVSCYSTPHLLISHPSSQLSTQLSLQLFSPGLPSKLLISRLIFMSFLTDVFPLSSQLFSPGLPG